MSEATTVLDSGSTLLLCLKKFLPLNSHSTSAAPTWLPLPHTKVCLTNINSITWFNNPPPTHPQHAPTPQNHMHDSCKFICITGTIYWMEFKY